MPKPTSALGQKDLSTPAAFARFRASVAKFRGDERGALALFVIYLFVFMLVFGGIAVDFMRYEIRRVAMQQTLDRAALAAANLEVTPSKAEAIAKDYFDKSELAGGMTMSEFGTPVVSVEAGSQNEFRKVRISADVRSYNYFMNMFFMPIDYLEGPAVTQAEQGVQQTEVMLVLDITGSMDETPSGDTKKKITGLIDAATYFVNVVKDADTANQVSIGIVPYNTQVNLGVNLRKQYTVTNVPSGPTIGGGVPLAGVPNVNCLETATTPAAFGTTSISRTTPMPMSVHADLESGASSTTSYLAWSTTNVSNGGTLSDWNDISNGYGSRYMCPPYAYSEVLLPTKKKAPLLAKIASLKPNGRTSIMMGMRWGVALLDETAKPIYDALVLPGEPEMVNRPAANNDARTQKIIVLMTDGNHVQTKFIRDPYKTGESPIFRSDVDKNFSLFIDRPGTNLDYWVPHLCTGATSALRDNCSVGWRAQPWSNSANTGTYKRLDWSEVWLAVRPTWVARHLYARSLLGNSSNSATTIYNNQIALFRGNTYVAKATMDSLLQTNCAAAKAAGFTIYGIAFGAGSDGETQIKGCASSAGSNPNDKTGFFFKPQNSSELYNAFRDIAKQVGKLRLTQ